MQWIKCCLHTTEEAEEMAQGVLLSLGIDSLEVEDRRPMGPEESGGLFGDVLPDLPEDDHRAVVSFYLTPDQDREALFAQITARMQELREFCDVGSLVITTEITDEEDWINNWKQYFHQFDVGDIRIVPSFETVEENCDAPYVLHIDPGTAFGTGKHESTQLAIRAIRKYCRPGDKVLDIGTGSGILGILALKLGASSVRATDIDDNVRSALADNLEKNGIAPETFSWHLGNIVDDQKTQEFAGKDADVVCANIIAEILMEITPEIPRHIKRGGLYILSGILTDREDKVIRSLQENGFVLLEREHMGEWTGLTARYEG